MLTLAEAVAAYGHRTTRPNEGEKVLFEWINTMGCPCVVLGEVLAVHPGEPGSIPGVTVRAEVTYQADGKRRAARDRKLFRFPVTQFLIPIGERLELVARHFEGRAGEARAWAERIKRDA